MEEPHVGARDGREPVPRRVLRSVHPSRAHASPLLRPSGCHSQFGTKERANFVVVESEASFILLAHSLGNRINVSKLSKVLGLINTVALFHGLSSSCVEK